MLQEDFVHLHVHSDYSLLDGCCKTDKLCEKAGALGHRAVALTDHGVLFGAAEFFKKAEGSQVKPLLGCEIYLVYEDSLGANNEENAKQTIYHMGIIARNFKGYQNLVQLVSMAHVKGFYRRPRTSLRELALYSEGLIGFSGCMSAVIPKKLREDDYQGAREACAKFIDIFGKDHFFIELMDHGIVENGIDVQKKMLPDLVKLAKEFGLKTVATNDVHYVESSDWVAHDSLLCIQTGAKLQDKGRFQYGSHEFYFKSAKEMEKLFHHYDPKSIQNTVEVAEMCELSLPFGENHYPVFRQALEITQKPKNEDFERVIDIYFEKKNALLKRRGEKPEVWNAEEKEARRKNAEYMIELCKQGMRDRYEIHYEAVIDGEEASDSQNPNVALSFGHKVLSAKDVCQRLDEEMAIIIGTGFVDYFLIVWDLIKWARDHGISVGPGRGSGAGCMVAYVLRITDIEPLRFGLLFERMLNLERISPPDFDVDFCMRRRDEVIQYARDKYGEDHVANIITFGTFGAKMIVRDLARINHLSFAQADHIAKMVPDALNISLEEALKGSVELQKEIKDNPIAAKIIEQGKVIEGMVRNRGTHACGIIISDRKLTELVPVTLQEGSLTTQYPKNPSEELGLLKMDFLGLKTLTVIQDTQEHIHQKPDATSFAIEKIGLEDPKTFQLLKNAETVGVFQMESEGMRGLCRQMEVSNIEEITALIALYRPGPMQFIPDYINGKRDPDGIEVPHPLIEDIVKETYGVLVYQEQVMEAARRIAGYTLGEADMLRRAMGKKIKEEMDAQKEIFVQGAKETNNIPRKVATNIFAILEKFAQYGFNKSHSAAYAILSYRTAFLKANYPTEFLAALLSSELGNADKLAHFIAETKRMGLKVLGPHINESRENFTPLPEKKCIRFGLAAIKGVGDVAAINILKEREKGGAYQSFHDFAKRLDSKSCNKRTAECLIKTGAFDVFKVDRKQLMDTSDHILKEAQSFQRDKEAGQSQLFDIAETFQNLEMEKVSEKVPMEKTEKLEYERQLLGFYLSGHPMESYAYIRHTLEVLPNAEALKEKGTIAFRQCGAIDTMAKKITKQNKRPWALFKLSNPEGFSEIVIYSEAYEKYAGKLVEGNTVCVEGEARWDNARSQIRLEAREVIEIETLIKEVRLCVRQERLGQVIPALSKLLEKGNTGNVRVVLEVDNQKGKKVFTEVAKSLRCEATKTMIEQLKKIEGVDALNIQAQPLTLKPRPPRATNAF